MKGKIIAISTVILANIGAVSAYTGQLPELSTITATFALIAASIYSTYRNKEGVQ